jgi:ferredoxin--NADP+ reductase
MLSIGQYGQNFPLCMNTNRWIQGAVVAQKRWTNTLLSLQVAAPSIEFEAGQFTKLALEIEGELVARPYSFVNAPQTQPYEFFYSVVPGGPLSARLAALRAGDSVQLSPSPAGFLVLSELPDAENLWLFATGTGIGPFLSILGTETPWRRYRRVILVQAARIADDLAYTATLDDLSSRRQGQFKLLRMLSREERPGHLSGRIPLAIADQRIEHAAGVELQASGSQVMLCGNPGMVADTTDVLKARGLKKHRRRDPGQITVENYW